jgi:hypothetical protein
MSVAPNAGIVDFGTFTPPLGSLDGIQGQVPAPLVSEATYILTAQGWAFAGSIVVNAETDPVFTYVNQLVTRIDYASGNYKLFTYVASILTQLDYIIEAVTIRKQFYYNGDGTLAYIIQTEF